MSYLCKYSEFLKKIEEGLIKTYDIDFTISHISDEMELINHNFKINKNDNKVELTLLQFRYCINEIKLNHILNLFINLYGWFPAKMKITNIVGGINMLPFNEIFLLKNYRNIETIIITFEAKYDIETELPPILFHLSIQEYEAETLKKGIITKNKSKLTKHLDRIYVCNNPIDCHKLIPRMHYSEELFNKEKSKKNIKWIIYEIHLTNFTGKLYKDPNYESGFYLIENIPPSDIKIFEKEK